MSDLKQLEKLINADLLQKIADLTARIEVLEAEQGKEVKTLSPWMTLSEAAKYLGFSKSTLHRHCQGGELKKHYDKKGSTRLLRADVEKYITSLV